MRNGEHCDLLGGPFRLGGKELSKKLIFSRAA